METHDGGRNNKVQWIFLCGWKGLCPRCGKGMMFRKWLKLNDHCPSCGLDYSFAAPDDGPAFFSLCIVAFPLTFFAVWLQVRYDPPFWIHLLTSFPLLGIGCLLPLQYIKGWLVASQYVNKAQEAGTEKLWAQLNAKAARAHRDDRSHQRTRTIYRLVQIERNGDEGLARCLNISDGGAALRLTMPVELNDELAIGFSPTVELVARVVWVRGNECGIQFTQPVDSQALLSSTAAETRAEGARPPRLDAGISGKVSFEDKVLEIVILDVSQRGAKLTHAGELKPGLKVKVLFNPGIEREGIVRWSRKESAGIGTVRIFVCGWA